MSSPMQHRMVKLEVITRTLHATLVVGTRDVCIDLHDSQVIPSAERKWPRTTKHSTEECGVNRGAVPSSTSVVAAPMHTALAPVIAGGSALTVNALVVMQLRGDV